MRVGSGSRPDPWRSSSTAPSGLTLISTNVLAKVMILDPGEEFTLFFAAGGGVEYQLQNRHYALGVAGGWHTLPEFDQTQGVSGRAYLRYTY